MKASVVRKEVVCKPWEGVLKYISLTELGKTSCQEFEISANLR
jgi:hypothetical protein